MSNKKELKKAKKTKRYFEESEEFSKELSTLLELMPEKPDLYCKKLIPFYSKWKHIFDQDILLEDYNKLQEKLW